MSELNMLVVNGLDVSDLTEEYVQFHSVGGADVWHKSMGGLRSFADVHNFVDKHPDKIIVVRNVREMHQAKEQGRLGLLLGWQTANPISTGRGGDNDWWGDPTRTNLRGYYELGLRIVGIAYQIANIFGGGAIDGHMGLSRAGRALVEEVHKLGMILDVGGHTGDQTSFDAIQMSQGLPVICSHGGARALADSPRNLSDEMIMAIANTGGVVGIPAITTFSYAGRKWLTCPKPHGVRLITLLSTLNI